MDERQMLKLICGLRRAVCVAMLWLAASLLAGLPAVYAQTESDDTPSQGAPLRVVTKDIEPFVFATDPDTDELRGFSIDLWQELARAAGFDYEFTVVGSVTEQLDSVSSGAADVGIAAISITEEREEAVDFSYPYFDSGLGILALSSSESVPPIRAILRPSFLLPMVGLFSALLLLIVLAGHVIWLLERNKNYGFPKAYLSGVWQGTWWAAVTVTTVGYGDKTPRGVAGRIFGLMWMFAGLFIIAHFTAGVTAQLTVQQIQGVISGPQDLHGSVVVAVEGSTADDWLTTQRIPHRTVANVDQAYDMLDRGSAQAVVYDYPVLLYYALHYGEGKVKVVGAPFNREAYGIALAEDSPLREQVNRALLKLREDGTYDLIYSKWYGEYE